MKKHLLISLLLCLVYAGSFGQTRHGDSAWYEGRYRSQEEMKDIRKKEAKEKFESWFMPGLGYSMYQPKKRDSTGLFSGLTVEYLIYANVDQNDDPGPSHVRVYSKLNILIFLKKLIEK